MQSIAKIVVERRSPRDIKMRDLYVRLDGHEERTLRFGEDTEIPVSPGHHRLAVTNRLFSKAISFDLRDGETARFQAANVATKGVLAWVMVVGGGVAYRVTLERL